MSATTFDQAFIDRIHTEQAEHVAAIERGGAGLLDVVLTISADGNRKRIGDMTDDDLRSRMWLCVDVQQADVELNGPGQPPPF